MLKTCIKKEVRGKYKGSFLGILWSFINPLLMTIVYTLIFTVILKNSEPNYVVFIIIGVLPWNYFQLSINESSKTFIKNNNIVKKVYFPRTVLPLSVNCAFLINYLISIPIILIFLFIYNIGLSWYILIFPIILLIEFILIQGLSLLVSSVTVYVRDFEYLLNFLLNILFYATPIIYSVHLFEGNSLLYKLIYLNPLTTIINSYRDIMFYKRMPNITSLCIVFVISILFLKISLIIFNKLSKNIAEEL